MIDAIFVYGTLMSGTNHPMGEKFRREATYLGPSHIQGKLYLVAWYPGLVPSDNEKDKVYGELYKLHDSNSLNWLDDYEGLATGDYERKTMAVQMRGKTQQAWVYIYKKPVDGLSLIVPGDFRKALPNLF